ncbi:Protein roller-3 [Dirofilaria immitis]
MSSHFILCLIAYPILVISFYSTLISITAATIFSDSLDQCQAQCVDRSLVIALARGAIDWDTSLLENGLTHLISACHSGCQDLDSTNSTCLERCAKLTPTDSCKQGCRAVTDIFLHHLQSLLNHVQVTIKGDSPMGINTVWRLNSDYSSIINDISVDDIEWAVQSRPANTFISWDITIFEKIFNVETLEAVINVPLVFDEEIELRLCISWRTYTITSPTHRLPVNDTDNSKPLPPTVISHLQISVNSFVICWKSALKRLYKISLYLFDEREISTALVESSCYLFQGIPIDNCCRVEIGYANSDSASASVSLQIDLINTERKPESAAKLIFTNGTSVMKLYDIDDYAILTDPKLIPFELKPGRSITALCSVSAERLLIALDDGSIYWLTIDDDEVLSGVLRFPDGTAIVHMDVDRMQGAVYAVLFKKGILRHIYCILNGGEVFSIPLFPLDSPQILPFSATEKLPILAFSIEAEPEKLRLVSLTQNGSILAINIVNRSVTDLRLNIEVSDSYNNIKKAHFLEERLFWISTSCGDAHSWDSCLYGEEYDVEKKKIRLNRYLYAGRVVDFVFLRDSSMPITISSPSKIGLIAADNIARITWESPILLPFQAQGAWRRLVYECRVTSAEDNENTAAEFTQLNETSLLIPISPGLQYRAFVRACINAICSSYATAVNNAFAPLTEPLFIAFHQTINNNINYYGMLGDLFENYALPAPIPKNGATVFAYDILVKSLYVAEADKSRIIRIRSDGSHQHFLDSVNVKFMTVMSRNALIVIASDYLIVTYRLTSTFDQEIYFCGFFNGCGEVNGLAGDDETGELFYLIRFSNRTTNLYALNQDVRTSYFIASAQDFPVLRQLIVVKEKLVFITETGEMGVCDKKLDLLNINVALKNVALAPIFNLESIKPINFIQGLTTDDTRSTLTWNIEPMFRKGKIIFKITLYKEHWGNEHFVDYSLSHNYTISDILLHQWPSKQKYDVEVKAITARDLTSINQTGLIAPTKPPTPPTNLTIYATQQKTVDGARALMDLFWDEPTEWNGEALGYFINCTVEGFNEVVAEVPATTRFYSFSVKSGSVNCAIAARNEPKLETFSEAVTIDSSELRPLVRLFAIDSNNNVFSISNWLPSSSQVLVREKRQTPPLPAIIEQSIAYIGNDLYSIRKDSDSVQSFLLRLDPNNVENILHKVSIGGEIGKVDALTSDWVANRLLFVSASCVMQLPLDAIQSLSMITPRCIMNLSLGAGDAKQLLFDPFSNTGFLLTKNGSLFALDLNAGIEENMALRLECLKSETVSWMMTDFVWNLASLPAIYVLTWNGMVRVDLTSSECEEIKFEWEKFGEKGLKSILSFAIADKLYIFVTSSLLVVYELSSSTATPIAISGSPLKQILVATQSTQPFPERSCFVLPPASEIKFTVQNEERSGALISVNEPQLSNICPGISLPPTQYEIHFQRRGSDKIRNIHSISNVLHVENGILDKEADYDISISWFNRYTSVSDASAVQMLRTGYGFPSSPQDPAAFALTPDVVLLYWKLPAKPNAPIPEIKYIISQLSATQPSPSAIGAQQFEGKYYATTPTDVVSCLSDPCSAKISNLRPSTDYKFWVRAIHESHLSKQFVDNIEGNSIEASVRTKDIAGTLRLDNITGTTVVLRWNSLDPESHPKRIFIHYRVVSMNVIWKSPYNASFEGHAKSVAVVLRALHSATTYDYRFAAEYADSYRYANHDYSYNETFLQVSQQFRTKPGTPSAPASIRLVQEYDEWIVRWEKPLNDGGSPITSYALEFRPDEGAEWEIAERGLEGDCLWWKPLRINFLAECAEFRIRAANSEGFGVYAYSKHHSAIPRVPKNNISLLRIIGKGGFGEVYEGVANGLPQWPTKAVRVAVKASLRTLRSGFSELDRTKFLQEAVLMQIYFCGFFNGCGEVNGLAGDDETGELFYLIRFSNRTTNLYALNQDVRTSYFIASAQDFPVLRQLIVVKEKLVFITETGEMGVCDKKLDLLNINVALKNVALAPIFNLESIKPINFIQGLTTDDTRSTLTWNIEPMFRKGKIIFKITLYKEHWGNEHFVDYSLSHNYTISDILLHQWPSKQKYDVEVKAITARDLTSINQTGLIAPTKPPTPPTNLTIYATQQKTVDGARALMDLFWDEPTEWNGEALGYFINCTVEGFNEVVAEVPATTRFYSFSVKSGSVNCAIAARNEPKLETFSEAVTIDSSELRPLVRLFAIDSNNNVFSISNWLPSSSQVLVREKRQTPPLPAIIEQSIAYIGNDLYSIRKDSDSVQSFLLRLDPNNVENILHKVSIGGEIGKVDALTSDWVANRLLFVSASCVMQLPLDAIQSLSMITPRCIMNLSLGAGDAKQLLFDPFSNTGFLLTKNGSLFALDLNAGIEENMALRLECLKSETVSWMMTDFVWNLASLPAIYVLTWNGMVRVDLTSSECEEIKFEWEKFGEKGLKSILSFAIADKLYIFVTSSLLVVYELSSSTATPIAISGSPLKQILVATQSTQPFPERSCFVLPPASEIKFTVQNEERSGALISVNEPQLSNICPGISLPPTQYEIHFQRRGSDKIRNIHSISNVLHVENGILDKEADYDISISWFNRYTSVSDASAVQMLRTGYGFPSSPQDPAAFALTPDVVLLYWKLPAKPNAPIPEIKYIISQLSATQPSPSAIGAQQFEGKYYATTPTDVVSCLSDPCSAKISNLRPSTDYKFWVRAIHESHLSKQFVDNIEGNSIEASVRTKDIAGTLRLDNITGTTVVLRWNSLDPESHPKRIFIHYRVVSMNVIWKSPYNASFEGHAKSVAVVLRALHSATTYDYRFAAEYADSYRYANHDYSYNETFLQVSQQFRTKPGTPSAPASIRLVQEYDEWIVRWEKPLNDGGSPITSYALEFRPDEGAEWEIAERGLEGDCLWWKPLRINFLAECAEFRIRAANSEGFGVYAYSKHHSGESHTHSLWIIIITLLIAILLLTAIIATLFIYYQRNDRRRTKIRLQDISLHGYTNSIKRNMLSPQIINDLKTIPRVPKNNISLLRIIGKGGFGEVYEGVANGLPQWPTKAVRVAVKTLRSGFSELDRTKFLQEAVLMHSFDHPNIVKLMGVSLETEPYFLVTELMEGGDLLGFLRSSRPSDCLPSQLSLYELIGMMVDVGRGAAYLEVKKRVHRDLAARNCLISSKNANTRITKIADFGHARDIYTNDYYRVHGDDFLPLRWLSPESINDRIFTSKSDVWSFGILLWEILTLGQQPFSGKNNVQVMSFVKNGGKLEKPQFCPNEIFAIVERAWIYDPEERPRFADLLPELEALRGCPLYQGDTPYPPNYLSLRADSNFELSFNSNVSRGESGRSGSVRFDKSDNPSTKKQGRPSILRSLRRDHPRPPSSLVDLEVNNRRSRSVNIVTSDNNAFKWDRSSGLENSAFISSDEMPKKSHPRKSEIDRSKQRTFESSIHLPLSLSSASLDSSSKTPSSGDSNVPSIYIRPARVSRV